MVEHKLDFYVVLVVAAVSIAALAYLVLFSVGGAPSMTGAVTGSAVMEPDVGGFNFIQFAAGLFLVFISGMIIYHLYHHK